MRHLSRRALIAFALLANGVAMLAAASPTMAIGVDHYHCVFNLGGTFSPGGFSFSTNGAALPSYCFAKRTNTDLGVGTAAAIVVMSGSGTYAALPCNGIATSTGGLTVAASTILWTAGTPPPLSFNAASIITFATWSGAWLITGASNSEGSGGSGSGHITFVPDPSSVVNCATDGSFHASGWFSLDIPVP